MTLTTFDRAILSIHYAHEVTPGSPIAQAVTRASGAFEDSVEIVYEVVGGYIVQTDTEAAYVGDDGEVALTDIYEALDETVPLQCPDCGKALKKGPLFREATTQVKRKCSDCGAKWSVMLRPKSVERGGKRRATVTTADFTRIDEASVTAKRDYRKEYDEYHAKPGQKKNRAARNAARSSKGLKVGDKREVDHKVPLSKGGDNEPENLRVVSRDTNRAKGDSDESAVAIGDKHTVETPRGPMVFELIDGRVGTHGVSSNATPTSQTWKPVVIPQGYARAARLFLSRKAATKAVENHTRLFRIVESLDENISRSQLGALERALDKLFAAANIDVEFTKHFMDRVNDARNSDDGGKPITIEELAGLFRETWKQHRKTLEKAKPNWQAIIQDLGTAINIPIVMDVNQYGEVELVAKTVMRKKDFTGRAKRLRVKSESLDESSQLNVATTPLAKARAYAEAAFEKAGKSLDEVIPDFDENYVALQTATGRALDMPRNQMPVIEPTDMAAFMARLKKGALDILQPWARGKLDLPTKFRSKPEGKEWVQLGYKDGDKNDDKLSAKLGAKAARTLIPTQSQIWLSKLVENIIQFGVPSQSSSITKATIIVSKEGYILDGHHRYGQAMLANPNLGLRALFVPLPIKLLLKVGRAYGEAIGNTVKEDEMKTDEETIEEFFGLSTKLLPLKGALYRVLQFVHGSITLEAIHKSIKYDLAVRFDPTDREIAQVLKVLGWKHQGKLAFVPIREDELDEGPRDKYVLKAVFMTGGAGAGKSFIADIMFGGTGLKVVNSDNQLEAAMKKAGLDLKRDMGGLQVQAPGGLRDQAKATTDKRLDLYLKGRLGLIIDSTAAKVAKVQGQVKRLRELGYDCSMVFVNTSLETALARNEARPRTVPVQVATADWSKVQGNLKQYKSLFGAQNFREVRNDNAVSPREVVATLTPQLTRTAMPLLNRPVSNSVGKKWLDAELNPRPTQAIAASVESDDAPMLDEDIIMALGLLGSAAFGAILSKLAIGLKRTVQEVMQLNKAGKTSAAELALSKMSTKDRRQIEALLSSETRRLQGKGAPKSIAPKRRGVQPLRGQPQRNKATPSDHAKRMQEEVEEEAELDLVELECIHMDELADDLRWCIETYPSDVHKVAEQFGAFEAAVAEGEFERAELLFEAIVEVMPLDEFKRMTTGSRTSRVRNARRGTSKAVQSGAKSRSEVKRDNRLRRKARRTSPSARMQEKRAKRKRRHFDANRRSLSIAKESLDTVSRMEEASKLELTDGAKIARGREGTSYFRFTTTSGGKKLVSGWMVADAHPKKVRKSMQVSFERDVQRFAQTGKITGTMDLVVESLDESPSDKRSTILVNIEWDANAGTKGKYTAELPQNLGKLPGRDNPWPQNVWEFDTYEEVMEFVEPYERDDHFFTLVWNLSPADRIRFSQPGTIPAHNPWKNQPFGHRSSLTSTGSIQSNLSPVAGYDESLDEAQPAKLKATVLRLVGALDTAKRSGNVKREQAAHEKLMAFTQENGINFENALTGARNHLNKKNPIGRSMSGFESIDEASPGNERAMWVYLGKLSDKEPQPLQMEWDGRVFGKGFVTITPPSEMSAARFRKLSKTIEKKFGPENVTLTNGKVVVRPQMPTYESLDEATNAHGIEFGDRQLQGMYDDEDEATRGTYDEWRSRLFTESTDAAATDEGAETARLMGIVSPNSSGQGSHPEHARQPYHKTLIAAGFTYSHTTPVGHGRDDFRLHHTYRLNPKFAVSVYQNKRGGWVWEGGVSGAGSKFGGEGDAKLKKYLSGASKRHRMESLDEATGIALTPQMSKEGSSVRMTIGGSVGKIEIRGEVRPFHLGIEKAVTPRIVDQLTTVNRADSGGKDMPFVAKRKVLAAVQAKLEELFKQFNEDIDEGGMRGDIRKDASGYKELFAVMSPMGDDHEDTLIGLYSDRKLAHTIAKDDERYRREWPLMKTKVLRIKGTAIPRYLQLLGIGRGAVYTDLREAEIDEASPQGKAQIALMGALSVTPVHLAELVRSAAFRGMNFAAIMSAAETLAKKGLATFDGSKIARIKEDVDEARISTKDPMTMTASQINTELAKLDAASSKLTSSFIEAGRGHERFSDIAKAKDPLALEMVAVTNRQGVLRDEGKARYGPKLIGNLPTHQRGKFGPRKKNEDVDEAVAPQGARVVKGVYYFKDRKVALAWAAANGWPPRVLGFDKGYVVQAGPSGSYAGPGQKPKEWKGYADFLRTKDESIDEHDVQYQSLNDATNYGDGYKKGSTEVWYARDSAMRNLVMGMDFLRKNAPEAVPTTKTYKTTHRLVGKVAEKSPDRVFGMMQGERWSPDGEARTMLAKQGLHHTSMSVGDIVRIGTKVLFVDRNGFTSLS